MTETNKEQIELTIHILTDDKEVVNKFVDLIMTENVSIQTFKIQPKNKLRTTRSAPLDSFQEALKNEEKEGFVTDPALELDIEPELIDTKPVVEDVRDPDAPEPKTEGDVPSSDLTKYL